MHCNLWICYFFSGFWFVWSELSITNKLILDLEVNFLLFSICNAQCKNEMWKFSSKKSHKSLDLNFNEFENIFLNRFGDNNFDIRWFQKRNGNIFSLNQWYLFFSENPTKSLCRSLFTDVCIKCAIPLSAFAEKLKSMLIETIILISSVNGFQVYENQICPIWFNISPNSMHKTFNESKFGHWNCNHSHIRIHLKKKLNSKLFCGEHGIKRKRTF